MAKDSTSLVIAHSSNATFQAWVNEVFTELITTCGLTRMSPLQDTGQMAAPCVTAYSGTANTAIGYYMAYFTDPLALGPLNTVALSAPTAGTGYNGGASGTFTAVNLSGGLGSGGKATVVLGASGVISSITVTTAGTGYSIGDQLFITSANMVSAGAAAGGGSSGFAFVGSLNASVATAVIKLEFGTGSVATAPQMFVTVGTSWASNGTLGALTCGALTTRSGLCCGAVPGGGGTTQYISRYIYNNTLGYLGMAFKVGTVIGPQVCLGGLIICRSNDASGNPTGVCLNVYTNCIGTTAPITSGGTAGCLQCMSYAGAAINPAPLAANSPSWIAACGGTFIPFNQTATLLGGIAFCTPCYYAPGISPVYAFSAYVTVALLAEIPIGLTVPIAIIGSTPLNFISIGCPWGAGGFGGINAGNVFLMLWQ